MSQAKWHFWFDSGYDSGWEWVRPLKQALLVIGPSLLCYGPTLTLPLIEDDYPNLSQARGFGSVEGERNLFSDSTFRLRATSYWIMLAVWPAAQLSPRTYHIVSLLLHIVATLLVFGLAREWAPMRKGALWAAAFFAVHEGHQEAVMWFSAINELLLFVFGMGALICWVKGAKSLWWHIPGTILFALALLSKESAVILLPLFLLVRWRLDWTLAPYVTGSALALFSVAQSRANSFRFSDGSFSLSAPFWITLPRSTFRLMWIWGLIAVIAWVIKRQPMRPLWLALAWIVIALVPYSFLTYSTAIPSRQIFLASAGLAMLVGVSFHLLVQSTDRRVVWAVAMLILVHNVATIWTKKEHQFLVRAAPTEQLLATIRSTSGPVNMDCFPYSRLIAKEAVRLAMPEALPRLVWEGRCQSPARAAGGR